MPVSGFRKLITWLLVLAIGHVPVPWAHNHEWLEDEQLEEHLDFLHIGADGNLPLGWHVHLFCIGLNHRILQDGFGVENPSDCIVLYYDQPQLADPESAASRRSPRESELRCLLGWYTNCTYACPIPLAASGDLNSHLSSNLRNGAHLYELFCSLLI